MNDPGRPAGPPREVDCGRLEASVRPEGNVAAVGEGGTVAARRDAVFVSVIVPHYNDLEQLRICYGRLLDQTWQKDKLEIIVADNNSECGLDAVRSAVPRALVVAASLQGAGPARNAGVAASRGEILAFLDSDCVPDADWVHEGAKALMRYDFVGGRVLTFARDSSHPAPVEAFEQVFNFDFRRYIEKVGFTGTGNMFVRKRVFDHVGGFRASVAEDMDWSFRARGLGYRLGYAPLAVVGHPARTNWADLRRRWGRMLAEDYELARERRFGPILFLAKAAAMPLSLIPHAAKVLRAPQLPNARARIGALAVLARLRLWRVGEMTRLVLITGRRRLRDAADTGMTDFGRHTQTTSEP